MRWPWKRERPTAAPKYHNFTARKRFFGHDYAIMDTLNGGQRIKVCGWKRGISAGDFLIFTKGKRQKDSNATTRYRVVEIRYELDPRDMFWAWCEFSPRVNAVRPEA